MKANSKSASKAKVRPAKAKPRAKTSKKTVTKTKRAKARSKTSVLDRAEAEIRSFALRFPETVEDFPWGHSAFKVKKKAFVFMGRGESFLSLSVKLPLSNAPALMFPFATPTGYGLGKSGWVSARFEDTQEPPIPLLLDWVEESFRAVAPKGVLKTLDAGGGAEPTKAAKPRTRKKTGTAVKASTKKTGTAARVSRKTAKTPTTSQRSSRKASGKKAAKARSSRKVSRRS